jgi:hypothetical protein
MVVLAGEPNQPVNDLWRGPTLRSFAEVDGQRRLRDLYFQMRPVDTVDGPRWMIYPGRDERVVRVLKKIIRGLCHYHGVATAVPEAHVWADVLKYAIPDELLASVTFMHREPDIIQYWYEAYDDGGDLCSVWYLRFFERTPFVGAVLRGPYDAQG